MTPETIAIIWIVSALVGAIIGQAKGKAAAGFVLGLLLGVIGILIAALMSKSPEKQAQEIAVMRSALGVSTAPAAPGGWWPDPMSRHEHRYYDGSRWTDNVSDGGRQSVDPMNS